MKIHPVEAELFHAEGRTDGQTDRQTDMGKLIVAFQYFASAPKTGFTHISLYRDGVGSTHLAQKSPLPVFEPGNKPSGPIEREGS
jgi:hypothetical protein